MSNRGDGDELPEEDAVSQEDGGCGGGKKDWQPERRTDDRTHRRKYLTRERLF